VTKLKQMFISLSKRSHSTSDFESLEVSSSVGVFLCHFGRRSAQVRPQPLYLPEEKVKVVDPLGYIIHESHRVC